MAKLRSLLAAPIIASSLALVAATGPGVRAASAPSPTPQRLKPMTPEVTASGGSLDAGVKVGRGRDSVVPPMTAPSGGPVPTPAPGATNAAEEVSPTLRWVANPDGTRTAQLTQRPVRFKNTKGEWQDIDLSLATQADGTLAAKSAPSSIKLGSARAASVELASASGTFSLGHDAATDAARNIGGLGNTSGRFVDAFGPGRDIVETITLDGFEESLVVAAPGGASTWQDQFTVPAGVTARQGAAGVEFVSRAGKVVAQFGGGLAHDSTPLPSGDGVVSSVATKLAGQTGRTVKVDVSADAAWLADPARVYPVTIDPSFTTSQAGNYDAYVDSSWPNQPEGPYDPTVLKIGTWNGGGQITRTYLYFDISSIGAAQITGASLNMYETYSFSCSGSFPGVTVQGAAGPRFSDQTVTWNNKPGASGAAATSGGFGYGYSSSCPARAVTLPVDTATVQGWANSAGANNGLIVSTNEGTNYGWKKFASAEAGISPPTLNVTYTPPPPTPANVVATPANATSANVSWSAATGATAYAVQVIDNGVGGRVDYPGNVTSYNFGSLTTGHSYSFLVWAGNGAGWGNPGSSGTINLNPPTVAVTLVGGQTVVSRGQAVTYQIAVTNPQTTTQTISSVTDTLPALVFGQGSQLLKDSVDCAASGLCSLINNSTFSAAAFTVAGGATTIFKITGIAVGSDRGCQGVENVASANSAFGSGSGVLPLVVCDTGLGSEDWWQYFGVDPGFQGQAKVNAANGNLVLSQIDATPVQAHGKFDFVLRRTYNSQDTSLISLPGSLGAGWTFNIAQLGDLTSSGVGAGGLIVPAGTTYSNWFSVTMVDRDGTRHVFTPSAWTNAVGPLAIGSGGLGTVVTGALSELIPKVLAVPAGFTHLCTDFTYQPPAGVHLSLWRYLAVNAPGVANPCGVPWAYAGTIAAGYAAVRPDRVRYEFNALGQMVGMTDGNGNHLRYAYNAVGLSDVWESNSCAGPANCRGYHLVYSSLDPTNCPVDAAYASGSVTCVKDPGGRTVRYVFDNANPKHLMKVVTLGVNNTDGSLNTVAVQAYTYQGVAGANCGGSANQMCSASDPRTDSGNHITRFAYTANKVNLIDPNQAGLEDGLTGWYPWVNSSITRTTAQAFDGNSAMAMTALAAGDMDATTPLGATGFPVTAGQTYTVTGAFRSASTARPVTLFVCWYTSANALVSCGSYSGNETAGQWNKLAGTLVAPAGATRAAVIPFVGGAAAGETHYVDGIGLIGGLAGTPARVTQLTDRAGTVTTVAYDDANNSAKFTTPNGAAGQGQVRQFSKIDASGRAGDVAGTSDATGSPPLLHETVYTWDRPGAACRQPDGTYPSTIAADSPTGYWRLNETSGTTAADSSGGAQSGAYANVTLGAAGGLPGDTDKAATFNGTTSYVLVNSTAASDFERTDPFSIEAWIKTTSTGIVIPVSKMNNVAPYRGYDILLDNGVARVQLINDYGAGNYTEIRGTTKLNDGGWHHLVVVNAGDGVSTGGRWQDLTIYVDGVADAKVPDLTHTLTATMRNSIPVVFATRSGGGAWFPGGIDDVALYRTALPWWRVGQHFHGAPADNNLCRQVDKSFSASSADVDTSLLYTPEGNVLRTRRQNGASAVDTTYGYATQYVQSDGTTTTPLSDSVTGAGNVASDKRPVTKAQASTRFYLQDRTQMLSPRGNAAPGSGACSTATPGYACYVTTYVVDRTLGVDPQKVNTGGTCGTQPAANTGNVCQINAPTFDSTNASAPATTTKFAYDKYGQKTSMTSPKGVAEGGGSTTYTYYQDGDSDLSGGVSAGGWLKAVTDPTGKFVAFGYDRARNVGRTWDRNATAANAVADFPGTLALPPRAPLGGPVLAYSETLYACRPGEPGCSAFAPSPYASPWRYLRSTKDPIGNVALATVDENGNQLLMRPGRGTAANVGTYDIIETYNVRDQITSTTKPSERAAGKATQFTYDAFANKLSQTDPNGHVVAYSYDAVNRLSTKRWARSASDNQAAVACPRYTDAFFPSNPHVCTALMTYDGLDSVITSQDANQQTTSFTYDALRRQVNVDLPRNDGTYSTLRTARRYDSDGNVTDICPPREFVDGAGACTATGVYSTHNAIDLAGRTVQSTTYRAAGQPITVIVKYDADGNAIDRQDGRGHHTTAAFNLLDRQTSMSVPRTSGVSNLTTYTYDSSGNTVTVTRPPAGDGSGRVSAYSYDANNRLVDAVDGADNGSAANAGLPAATGGTNIRTRTTYDADGNVVAVAGPDAFVPYAGVGDPRDNPNPAFTTRRDYDEDGRIVASHEPRYSAAAPSVGTDSTQARQCPNEAPYPSDVGVCVSRYHYDYAGNLTQVDLPTIVDGSNRYVGFDYTDDNLLWHETTPSPVTDGQRVVTATHGYDGDGRQTTLTDANGNTTAIDYTAEGLTKRVTGEPGVLSGTTVTHITNYEYDANGQSSKVTNARNEVTRTTYTSDGLVDSVYDNANRRMSYQYDANGNPTAIYSKAGNSGLAPNTANRPVSNTFTDDNLLSQSSTPIDSPGTSVRVASYAYDAGGRKVAEQTTKTSGGAPPPITCSPIVETSTICLGYYPNDRLATQTGRGGAGVITTTYNASGSPLGITDAEPSYTRTLTASYYQDQNVRTVSDGSHTAGFAYNGSGAPTVREDASAGAVTSTYTYGDSGLPKTQAATGIAGNWQWTYDPAGRPTQQTAPNGQATSLTWDNDGTLREHKLAGGTVSADWINTYDELGRLTDQNLTSVQGAGAPATVAGNHHYTYDSVGRLATFTDPVNGARSVAYDGNDNRIGYGTAASASYNADNSLASSTLNGNTRTVSQDDQGRTVGDGCLNYAYDGFDRTRTATGTGAAGCGTATTTTYTYDGLDRQTSHSSSAVTTALHYDGLSQALSAAEPVGTGFPTALSYVVNASGQPLGYRASGTGGGNGFFSSDGNGNVTTITDATGAVACETRFDPYGTAQNVATSDKTDTNAAGQNTCDTGTAVTDVFYRAGRHDTATGQYLFGSRSYDPATATWTTADSHRTGGSGANLSVGTDPLTANRYSYVNGDPVNLVDPSGHAPCAHGMIEGGGCDEYGYPTPPGVTSEQVDQINRNFAQNPDKKNETQTVSIEGQDPVTLTLYQSVLINVANGGAANCTLGGHGEITVYDAESGGCGVWVVTHDGGWRQSVADFAGGVLNNLSMGHAKDILSVLGEADKVDYNSTAFKAGEYTAAAVQTVVAVKGAVEAVGAIKQALSEGASVGDIARSLIPFGRGGAAAEADEVAQVVQNGTRGRAFEADVQAALGETKGTLRVVGTEGTSIPDVVGGRNFAPTSITEVKDVARLSLTKQMRIQNEFASAAEIPHNLVVSANTVSISAPLREAIAETGGTIRVFDSSTQTFKAWLP